MPLALPTLFVFLAMLLDPLAGPAKLEKGEAVFKPVGDQTEIPDRYRLKTFPFKWDLEFRAGLTESGVDIYDLRFPSPVKSPHAENNTVYAEYYRPHTGHHLPGMIVLDITAGDQSVSRMIATHLATQGIAALFVQMPYYGPRRPPGAGRMITANYERSMENVRQCVLDMRVATTWLENRPEIDAKKLGILGTSLGSFLGSLTAEMEPRLRRVVILLGGGGLVDAYYDDPRGESYRKAFELLGGNKDLLKKMIAPADPLTCAANLQDRSVLMIAARRDEIVFPKMAKALWQAAGKPPIVWYDCTHYGAALYFVDAMNQIVKHLRN